MKLSLPEAATVLGKSERQIRYLIRLGQLPARKDGGRWRVESADLPLSEPQRAAFDAHLASARQAVEKALAPVAKAASPSGEKKGFSVIDLDAFTLGAEILRAARTSLGEEDLACRHLAASLTLLTRGCHSFHATEKARRFLEAREEAATAVAALLLASEVGEGHTQIARRLEQELIPKISGLIALHEKRSRRSRFDQFGSGPARGRAMA